MIGTHPHNIYHFGALRIYSAYLPQVEKDNNYKALPQELHQTSHRINGFTCNIHGLVSPKSQGYNSQLYSIKYPCPKS